MKEFLKRLIGSHYCLWRLARWVQFIPYRMGVIKIQNLGGCARIKKNVAGKGHKLVIGRNATVQNLELFIRGDCAQIEIGEGVVMGHGCSIRCEGDNIRVVIGNNTTMTRDIHMFSNNIIVRTSDSHPIYDAGGVRLNPPADVHIGNHVWIAPETTVMKGVTIGDNAILGSKTLVTRDIPAGCLGAGVPARVIKENVHWTRESLF